MKQILSFLAVALVAAVACSDSFKPTTENIRGDYSVQTFTTTDTGGTIDWVKRGGTFTLTLGPLGTTTGHLFMPRSGGRWRR